MEEIGDLPSSGLYGGPSMAREASRLAPRSTLRAPQRERDELEKTRKNPPSPVASQPRLQYRLPAIPPDTEPQD